MKLIIALIMSTLLATVFPPLLFLTFAIVGLLIIQHIENKKDDKRMKAIYRIDELINKPPSAGNFADARKAIDHYNSFFK